MAWWTTQLSFQSDTLISEGLEPIALENFEWVDREDPPPGTEHYTRVIISGYALYGQLRGYYALGVAHWYVDRLAGRLFISAASQRNSEPVSSLTPAQRSIIRDCLMGFNLEAWESSNRSFRSQLEA